MNIPANVKKEGAKRLRGRYEKPRTTNFILPTATDIGIWFPDSPANR
jgi:hypothetical protein